MDKHVEMGHKPTGRLLLRYSLPAIAGMVLTTAYNIVDRVIVGQATGTTGLAAMTVGIPFLMFGAAAAGMAQSGGASLIGRRLGAGDRQGAERALAQACLLGGGLNALTALLLWPLVDPILRLFGADAATAEPARAFALAMLVSFPLQGISQGLFAGLASQGRMAVNLGLLLCMLAVNTGLCLVFVCGLGLGTAGSAWAIAGAHACGILALLAYYRSGGGALGLAARAFRPHGGDLRALVQAGIGSWLGNVLPAALILVVNRLMAHYQGNTGLALVGIVHVVGLMAIMPVAGIMQAAAPLVSYNHGRGLQPRVRRVLLQAWGASTLILLAFWLPIQAFPAGLAALFAAGDQALKDLGSQTFRIFFLSYPAIGVCFVMALYYQATGTGWASALNALGRQVLFLVPLMVLMHQLFGFAGFVWATPLADALGCLLSAAFWFRESLRFGGRPAGGPRQAAGQPGVSSAP